MSPTAVSPTVRRTAPAGAASPPRGHDRVLRSPVTVVVGALLGCAAFVADAASGESRFGIVGVAVLVLALALTLVQAVWASVGRPERTSRRAAATGASAGLCVAAFLSSVGVLERMGPHVTSSAAFAAGVAVMSVVLLVVLPVALVVFGWCVSRDRRVARWARGLPSVFVLVVAAAAVAVATTDGSRERWLSAGAAAVAGAVLAGVSAGLSRVRAQPTLAAAKAETGSSR